MRNFSIKRFTASLLLIVMLVAAVPATMFNFTIKASAAEGESSTIIDGAIIFTDLHTNSSDYKQSTLEGVLNRIKNNHSGVTFTSITSGGDAFSVNEDDSKSNGPYEGYTSILNGYITGVLGDSIDINYTWSDHDRYAYDATVEPDVEPDVEPSLLDKTSHLSYGAGTDGKYGTNDDGNYYVYTLSMADLCSYDRYSAGFNYTLTSNNRVANGFTETVPLAIQQFKDDVAKLHKDRPLFIVSHQPLFDNRNDNAWAEDWFDAINTVAAEMDVAFFYGHNHKYDTGSDYYYAKGSTMPVATQTNWNWNYETGVGYKPSMDLGSVNKTLNFTHMCAGYLAPSSTNSTSNTTREGTALSVIIYEDSISYVTYNAKDVYTGSYAANYTVKRDHAVVTPVVPDATYEDNSGLGISITAPGITGVNASKVTKAKPEGYAAYITYDINPVGYTSGDTATVVVPVDSSFDPTKPVQVIDGEKVIVLTNIVDGKVTFTTNHFSEYSIAQLSLETSGGNWVTITEPTGGTKTYTYTLDTDGTIEAGEKYLIVSGTNALTNNSTATAGRTTVKITNNTITLTDDSKIAWTFSSDNGGQVTNGSYGLRLSSNNNFLGTGNNIHTMVVASKGNGGYTIQRSDSNYYVRYSNNSWSRNETATTLYLYKCTATTTSGGTNGTYAMIDGNLSYTLDRGTSAEDALAAVMAGITGYKFEGQTAPEDGVLTGATVMEDSELGWELEAAYGNGITPGEFAVTITYNGIELGVAKVVVPDALVVSAELLQYHGEVNRGVGASAHTGAMIRVTYDDGTTEEVEVTLGMITDASGNPVSTETINENGYTGLTVTYNGRVLTNENPFTLIVLPKEGNNYPDFPDEGAVKVNKTAIYKDDDFRKTGVAQVELSVSGIAMDMGVDVIVMLDTSSSMTKNNVLNADGTDSGKTRAKVLEEALQALFKQLKAPNPDGSAKDIRVAVADFNGYYGNRASTNNTPYDRDAGDTPVGGNDGYSNQASEAKVYTGDGSLGVGAFVNAQNLPDTVGTQGGMILNYTSGTNYDYAFDAIYQLGTAIKATNTGEERELFVIFMSDGAALQWNYFTTEHGNDNGNNQETFRWNNWLGGLWKESDLTTSNLSSTTHSYFYDLNDHDKDGRINEHRMANAIKGDPTKTYEIIRKSTAGLPAGTLTSVAGKEDLYMVPGLGATMYTINFDAKRDGDIREDVIDDALSTTASDSVDGTQYYYKVRTVEALATAFNRIATNIAYAANNARFEDQMGDTFDLQLAGHVERYVTGIDGEPEKIELDFKPTIEVKSYDIYTRNEHLADPSKITADMIGTRKGTYSLLEVVMFSTDGKKAYSNKVDVDGDGIYGVTVANGTYTITDADDNILDADGMIYASTFYYNTDIKNAVTAKDASITVQPETFYWKVGTVKESELAISYYVYLTDTIEGERQSGSYATNNFAILYYDNYLGNPCKLETVSPMLAWREANVSYAFYLVNRDGQVVVNRTTGQTGTFADKIAVTRPIVYSTVKLNTAEEIKALAIVDKNDILPEGYELYDEAAAYRIVVLSATDEKIGWTIQAGSDKVASTYVTGFSSSVQYSNDKEQHGAGYDFTHTTVWFAVVWIPSTIPDQVVIDYGVPVDINVLENDQFGANGSLNGLGTINDKPSFESAYSAYNTVSSSAFKNTSLALRFGTATIRAGKIRYTPTNMIMSTFDRFAYEVEYKYYERYENGQPVDDPTLQYYYGTVTVIPATNIYYEENFVTFEDAAKLDADGKVQYDANGKRVNVESGVGAWIDEGTYTAGATQDEDRPGKSSLSGIDHDNVYGYDAAYTSYKKFSLGAAKKVSVNAAVGNHKDNSPTAKFTFTGTGFDIISMTNSDSGVIFISVYEAGTTTAVSNKFVDNYYGYTYTEENGWTPAPGDAAIYQVPVMKFAGLPYGTYDVVIWVTYGDYFDHDTASANGTPGYSFWLDSIRIYDPANDGKEDNDNVIEDAYGKDNESNPSYLEIGDAILPANSDFTKELPGAVFIDGNKNTNSAADYAGPGPNNEVYLYPGQAIAFKLSSKATPLDVQIGVKLAFGDTADVQFTYSANGKSESRIRTFTTATDMYYSIASYLHFVSDNQQSETAKSWESGTITLMNVSGSVISLTNIKATFKMASYGGNAADINGTPAEISSSTDTEVIENAAAVVTKFFASKPKPVLEVFDPETLAYTVVSGMRGINTVRVITSNDADAITVNGIEAKKIDDSKIIKSMVKMLDKLYGDKHNADDYCVWTVEVKSAPVYDIVAFRIVEIPDPSIDASAVFEPETVAHTVISNINGTNTVRVITSKDVSSIIVNGVKAEKINDAKILKSMVKMLDKLYDDKHNESDYYVWTVDVKSAASYDIVAFNEDGVSTIPAIENTKNVSNK